MVAGLNHSSGHLNNSFKHGMTGTTCYRSWLCIKKRCFNTASATYQEYGALGVTMESKYIDSFLDFYYEVGDPPNDNELWSIDRIDNTKGYVEGNMRWSTPDKQARNRGIRSDNTSGTTGVRFEFSGNSEHSTYAVADWKTLNGKRRKKTFSVDKLGLLPAFQQAIKYRQQMIELLNQQGAGYTLNHGK